MNREDIIEREKQDLLDYLFSYCDTPLATADDYLQDLFYKYNVTDVHTIREILEESFMDITTCTSPPVPIPCSIYLDVAEIEIDADMIDPAEHEDYFINGELAYLYIGYGFIVEFSSVVIECALREEVKHAQI